MRLRDAAPVLGAIAASLCALTCAVADPTYVKVDGAPSPPATATYLFQVNAKGDAVGYFELSSTTKGFIYKADGTIVEVNDGNSTFSTLAGINKSGATAGTVSGDFSDKGIAGKINGKIKKFGAPDGKNATQAQAISDNGEITGAYLDEHSNFHGFVRSVDGAVTEFDAPGAGSAANQGTFPIAINATGSVAGYFADSSNTRHCFARDASEAFTTFDVDVEHTSTTCQGINAGGVIAGTFKDSAGSHGFLRAKDGAISTFDAPGGGIASGQGTFTRAINKKGTVAGYVIDSAGVTHGFVRVRSGKVTVFDMPDFGGVAVTATFAQSINDKDEIAGYYTDASNIRHGFLRLP